MKSERWRRVEALFHQVVEMDEPQREAYLQAASDNDSELLREVKDLLRSYQSPDSFMEDPVFSRGLQALGSEHSDTPADELGRYRIIKKIGVGGMGEVFLAHDSVLNRQVALKLLPASLTTDPQSVRRFQQEAYAASTISHPNVAHIYEIAVQGTYHFTTMEYVEGRTLREVLNQGRLTVTEALEIALQVARALESAHASGVIHRDIKPENIMIRPDGYVKVLDFGLAKFHRVPAPDDPRQTHTATMVHTEPGLIIGSPSYMSPEQARGVDVDARTDIWSLGVVLYEMLCGFPPFKGSTTMDLIVALLREDPSPISATLRHAHPRVRKLLNRMLSKDKDLRYLTSAELVTDLCNLVGDVRWTARQSHKSTLFQGSRLAFLKHKASQVFYDPEGTTIKAPVPLFLTTVVVGIALTWCLQSFRRPAVLPKHAESEQHYQAGVEAIFRDDLYTAVYQLDQAATPDLHARSILAQARLAEVWTDLDYSDRANYELSRLVNLISLLEKYYTLSDVDALYVNAVRATISRNFRSASELYKRIVEKDQTNAIAWMDLGRSYERLDWLDEAAYSYRQAGIKNPSQASAFLRLGTVELARNNEREAITAFDRAHELYRTGNDKDGLWELLNRREILALRLGRKDEARKFDEEAARLDYFNEYQYVKHQFAMAGMFHKQEELAKGYEREARKHADSISRVGLLFHGPDQLLVNAILEIADLYMRDNDLINAQQYVLEALSIARRSDLKLGKARALYAYAQLYLHEGFPENADREFKQMLRVEFPNKEISDKNIALWRNTILDVDYDLAIGKLRNEYAGEALIIPSD